MAIFPTITQQELESVGVVGLPDTPSMTARAMQEKFEETARSLLAPKFNALAAQLEGPGGAAVGAAVPEGLLLIPTHTFRNIREDGPVFNVRSTMPCIGHGALRGRYPRQSRRGRGGDGLRALASCVPFRGGVRERRAGICARRPALAHPHAHDRQLWPAL